MPRCLIALGGNLGPVDETFRRALERLASHSAITVGAVSTVHVTTPVGEQAGSDFHNAAAELTTGLPPLDLLDALQQVETEFGRTRDVHWGPRTLDLDLIFYGERVIDLPRLQVPHPACWYRRFVLDPLVEIAADVVHPVKRATVAELLGRLLPRPLRVSLAGGDEATRRRLIASVCDGFADVVISQWAPGDDREQPSLLLWLGPDPSLPQASVPFESLPPGPRLDAFRPAGSLEQFLCDVVRSALGR